MSLTLQELEQLVPTINSIAKVFYYNSSFYQLRKLYELEDYQQSVFFKLLYRDNYKRYSDSYKLKSYIYRVCKCVAIQLSVRKNTEDCILDAPIGDGSTVLIDRVAAEELNIDPDISYRIERIVISMPEEDNPRVCIQAGERELPFSLENLFRVFLDEKCSKEELSRMVINRSNGKPVTYPTFLKMWNQMVGIIEQECCKDCL